MEEKMLTLKQESEIKEKAQKIKEEKKLRKIYPMVVFGEAGDEKEVYVAYMSEPTFPQFSKFMAASKKDEVMAMRTLAYKTWKVKEAKDAVLEEIESNKKYRYPSIEALHSSLSETYNMALKTKRAVDEVVAGKSIEEASG